MKARNYLILSIPQSTERITAQVKLVGKLNWIATIGQGTKCKIRVNQPYQLCDIGEIERGK